MKHTIVCLGIALSACGRGAIEIQTTLPRPASENGSGVIVDVPDGSSVCDRVQIKVYAQAPTGNSRAFPANLTPVASGGGFGQYSAATPECTMIAFLDPGDYWAIVSLPRTSFYAGGFPTLAGSGGRSDDYRAAAYPIHVDKGKTTKLALRLAPY